MKVGVKKMKLTRNKFLKMLSFVTALGVSVFSTTSSKTEIQVKNDLESMLNLGVEQTRDLKEEYEVLCDRVTKKREELGERYKSSSEDEKDIIIEEARNYLFDMLVKEIFPSWYGTNWNFNGNTQIPQEGNIACGYFITTTLEDAGFELDRIRLAQQPSEHMIKNLVEEDNIRRYSNKDIEFIKKEVQEMGEGLYIVGLDIHVGFIVNNNGDLRFIHSSYYNPPLCVVSESVDSFNPLAHSKYRVIGKLLGNSMIEKWLSNEFFELEFDYLGR